MGNDSYQFITIDTAGRAAHLVRRALPSFGQGARYAQTSPKREKPGTWPGFPNRIREPD